MSSLPWGGWMFALGSVAIFGMIVVVAIVDTRWRAYTDRARWEQARQRVLAERQDTSRQSPAPPVASASPPAIHVHLHASPPIASAPAWPPAPVLIDAPPVTTAIEGGHQP